MDQNFERSCFTMEARLIREHGFYYHPRTKELIIGIEHDEEKRPDFDRLNKREIRLPAIRYHTQQNRSCSVKCSSGTMFAVSPNGTCTIIPNIQQGTEYRGRPTGQWKSVWFSKHSRRA